MENKSGVVGYKGENAEKNYKRSKKNISGHEMGVSVISV
jgi:hypothetical protein